MGEQKEIMAADQLPDSEPRIIAAEQLPAPAPASAPAAKKISAADPSFEQPIEFSNGIRLTCGQWLIVGLYVVLLTAFAPWVWEERTPFEPGPDYRMPHDLGNDYWLYERHCRLAVAQHDIVLVGDSVVWGEYVKPGETLSHYLNDGTCAARFANLGLDGAHPLALTGLVDHYAGAISGKYVILHCNPLWLSSPRADLQDDQHTDFNHPRLVPQFWPSIPAYKEEMSTRLGVLVEQRLPFGSWTTHLQQAYYERSDIPGWTLEHPYDNPLKQLSKPLPAADDSLRHLPQPWYQSGIARQDYPWVDLETSLQWQAFQRVVDLLQRRGNRVFVLVGPFNEHMLEPDSLRRYQRLQAGIKAWLEEKQISYLMPTALASEYYGDASHPLATGYALLAKQVMQQLSQGGCLP